MTWLNCIKGDKSKVKLIIKSDCFTKKKVVFNVSINEKETDKFFEGLREYIQHWEEIQ
jgi:hypothetical protein